MISIQDKSVLQKFDFKDSAIWLATWFCSGFVKPAPGTWGTLAALPFGLFLMSLSQISLIVAVILIIPIGLWASARFTKAAEEKDSSMIVIDEVAGMWIALIPAVGQSIISVVVAFALFRFFDILKPGPISWLDKNVNGAPGVMADDILAGIFTALCLVGLQHVGLG